MSEMIPRERVLKAVEHKEPDRVPINFGGTLCAGIIESIPDGRIYTRLCEYLGFGDRPEPAIADCLNIVTNVDERVQKSFGADIRVVAPGMRPAKIETDGTKTWEAFCGVRIKKMGYYDEFFDFPMRNITSVKEIKSYPFWPDPEDPFITEGKREEAKRLHEETGHAIAADSFFSAMPFNLYAFLTGTERWYMDMKLNPRFYFALCDKLLELGIAMNTRYLKEVGEFIDIFVTYDDIGGQEGLLISHSDYRKFIHPYTKLMIEAIKKHTDAKIFRHCCGSAYDAIQDFIEIGTDIYHPAQPGAKNMEPWRLKKEFGKDITFCTGIDIQRTLPFETPKGVEEAVKQMIEVYAPGGGFIIAPTHNIEPDTAPENIVAAFDAAKKYGRYPISI